jgi:DNA-binding protein YbaB
MFEQLKQLKKIQEIQNALKDEKITYSHNGIEIIINGKLEVEAIKLNPMLAVSDQERALKDAFNEAMKKVQMVVAQKMQSMGGFGM